VKKAIIIGISALLLLLVVAGVFFWYLMSKPLYEPGMVRAGKNLRASLVPPAQSGEQDFWSVEPDVKLYHFADGAGKNVLVIHGGPGYPFRSPWPGLKPLADRYRFIYYHQRGCGRSTRPIERFASSNYLANVKTLDAALGLGAQIADVERVRRILGEEQLVIVGHSFGGFLASLYAAEFPERVKALILVAPADILVMPAKGGGLFAEVNRHLPAGMKNEYAAFLKRYLDFGNIFSKSEAELAALNSEFAKYYQAAAATKNLSVPEESAVKENGGWMVFGMYLSMGRRHDYRAALKNVQAPVLVIHGDQDLQPEGALRAYAACFPNASVQVIKNAGHFLFSERPEEFAAVTGKFLDGLNQPSP
jgi:proline iminopeptidase